MSHFYHPLRKTGAADLPNDPSLWRDEIYQRIVKAHPYLSGALQGDIDWSIEPVDEVEGNGVGCVTALIGKTPVQIPVVVRERELSSVDLYLAPEGTMDILDQSIMLRHASETTFEIGDRIPRFSADAGPSASNIVNKLAGYDRFRLDFKRTRDVVLGDYPGLSASFDRLEKAARITRAPAVDALSVELFGNSVKVAAFSAGEALSRGYLSRSEALHDLNSKIARLVTRASQGSGAEVLVERTLDKEARFFSGDSGNRTAVLSAGQVVNAHLDGAGVQMRACLRSGLEGDPLPGQSDHDFVLIGAGGSYTMNATNAVDVAATATRPDDEGVPLDAAMQGDWGFFEMQPNVVYGPVRYEGMIRTGYGGKRLVFRSRSDGAFYVSLGEQIARVTRMRGPVGLTSNNLPSGHTREYIVPQSTRFLAAGREVVLDDPMSEAKLASATLSAGLSVVELKLGHGGFMAKTAMGSTLDMTESEAQAMLMSLGASATSAMGVVKAASDASGRALRVYGLEAPFQKSAGEDASLSRLRPQVDRLIQKFAAARGPILKLASAIEATPEPTQAAATTPGVPQSGAAQPEQPEPIQDTLSAVNLLSPQNASRFVEAREEVMRAKRTVADLLYKTRIGEAKSLDEKVVREALFGLKSIGMGLDELVAAKEMS